MDVRTSMSFNALNSNSMVCWNIHNELIYDMYVSSIGTEVEFDDVYDYMMCIGKHKDLQLLV